MPPLDLLVVIALGKHRQVLDVRPPFQEKFEARIPNALDFIKQNDPQNREQGGL